ncbi:Na-translocating system protein MpsC family protein [Alkalihalobacterium alkalicellulosilyticum]|uniref:Na-translocating system protein MpsC family protein n=1 Tax=Alkalihalobacterium alkalicellulosilyticum TaxID=1912214 RepID=UPI000997134B|nr:Na-translocating system protein MpsC family protein [Bacillus alkalicellulosilyticus]
MMAVCEPLEILKEYVNELYEVRLGKTPERVDLQQTSFGFVLRFEGYLTHIEKTVLVQKGPKFVKELREISMLEISSEIKKWCEENSLDKVDAVLDDWNYFQDTGCILVKTNDWKRNKIISLIPLNFIDEVRAISSKEFNRPLEEEWVQVNDSISLLQQKGFLLPFDRTMVDKGLEHLLYDRECNVRGEIQKHKRMLEESCNREIADIFLNFNYEKDVVTFIFFFINNE